jgi:hypothetical protein
LEHPLPELLDIQRNHAWQCPSPFQSCCQKLPWDCRYWVVDRKAGTRMLLKSFTRPKSLDFFLWGIYKIVCMPQQMNCCTVFKMAITQFTIHLTFSVHTSIYASLGQTLSVYCDLSGCYLPSPGVETSFLVCCSTAFCYGLRNVQPKLCCPVILIRLHWQKKSCYSTVAGNSMMTVFMCWMRKVIAVIDQ